jgi:hypothetical protein
MMGGEKDDWLRGYLAEFQGQSPGELADKLLELSGEESDSADDSTVIAVRLSKRAE